MMDLDRNSSEGARDLLQTTKKRRGRTYLSALKALKRSAIRKRGGISYNGDGCELEEFDGSDEEGPLEFRLNVKMQSINLDTILKSRFLDEVEEGEQLKDMLEERELRGL